MYRVRRCLLTATGLLIALTAVSSVALAARQIEFWSPETSTSVIQWIDNELLPRFKKETGITVVHKPMNLSNPEAIPKIQAGQGPDVLITY